MEDQTATTMAWLGYRAIQTYIILQSTDTQTHIACLVTMFWIDIILLQNHLTIQA